MGVSDRGVIYAAFKPFVCLGLVAVLLLSESAATAGVALAKPNKSAAMVMDANTGKILHSESGYARRFPASLTKMMTLYMAFDLIEQGRMSYDSLITVSKHAANAPPSKLGLKAGSRISFRNAAKALAVKSANDIARAVAEHIGGSETNFARLMTRKARAIGMGSTTFRNASGLPNSEQKTTARDMITLALRLQDEFPKHYKVFKTRTFSYRGKRYRSYNTLLGRFRGTDGIKTGYTRASGFNLVSSVRRDGKHVVAAVFGGRTGRARNAKMRALLRRGLAKASRRKTRRKTPLLVARAKPAKRPKRRIAARPASAEKRKPVATATRKQQQYGRRKTPTIKIANVHPVETVRTKSPPKSRRWANAEPTPPEFTPRRIAAQSGAAVTREELPNFAGSYAADPKPAYTAQQQNNGQARRGRRPSTLQEQMAVLETSGAYQPTSQAWNNDRTPRQVARREATRTAYRLQSPARQVRRVDVKRRTANGSAQKKYPAPVTANATRNFGNFVVQIGAYRSQNEAKDRLADVSRSAKGLLNGYKPHTERAQSGNRSIYRARFAGFDSSSASSTCNALRRRGIDCFVKRTD